MSSAESRHCALASAHSESRLSATLAPHHRLRDLLLALDHLIDPVLQRPRAEELVDLDPPGLSDPEGPVVASPPIRVF